MGSALSSLFREPKSTANREKEPENKKNAFKLSDSIESRQSIEDSTDDDEKSDDDENNSAKAKGVKRKKRSHNPKSSKKSKKLGSEFEESFLPLLHQPLIRNHKRERKTPTRFTELPSKKRKYTKKKKEELESKIDIDKKDESVELIDLTADDIVKCVEKTPESDQNDFSLIPSPKKRLLEIEIQ